MLSSSNWWSWHLWWNYKAICKVLCDICPCWRSSSSYSRSSHSISQCSSCIALSVRSLSIFRQNSAAPNVWVDSMNNNSYILECAVTLKGDLLDLSSCVNPIWLYVDFEKKGMKILSSYDTKGEQLLGILEKDKTSKYLERKLKWRERRDVIRRT